MDPEKIFTLLMKSWRANRLPLLASIPAPYRRKIKYSRESSKKQEEAGNKNLSLAVPNLRNSASPPYGRGGTCYTARGSLDADWCAGLGIGNNREKNPRASWGFSIDFSQSVGVSGAHLRSAGNKFRDRPSCFQHAPAHANVRETRSGSGRRPLSGATEKLTAFARQVSEANGARELARATLFEQSENCVWPRARHLQFPLPRAILCLE